MFTPQLPAGITGATSIANFAESIPGQQWLDNLTDHYDWQRYQSGHSQWTQDQLNKIASQTLDAKYKNREPEFPDSISEGYNSWDCWHDSVRDEIMSENEDLDLSCEWLDDLYYYWSQKTADKDTSSFSDLFGRHDRCEILYVFMPMNSLEDSLCHFEGSYCDYETIVIDHNFQHALYQLGFSIGEYRKHSGNRSKSFTIDQNIRPQPRKLATPDQLKEMLENNCSSNFLIAAYANVPIQQIFDIDIHKTIKFS
ncbi:MAG: hypothetical protein HC843_04325, partial [Sphingomonadales bacterium]|nr:hypothetical protein [Sphingomonadales bacterium]